jgi:hypothetical protein
VFYLVPQIETVLSDGETIKVPKYVEFSAPFSAITYGGEGWTIVSTDFVIAAAPDVYQFPQDLQQTLSDSDVSAFDAFLAQVNAPSTWISAGTTFAEVLRQLAQIFLVAEAISGANGGASIFAGGATLDSSTQAQPTQQLQTVGGAQPAAPAPSLVLPADSQVGPFDFSGVSDTTDAETTLLVVSQQFQEPIIICGGTL